MSLKLKGFKDFFTSRPRGVRPGDSRPVCFVTPREMSFHPFSMPFSDLSKIRQAMALQLAPLMGEDPKQARIHPVVLHRDQDRTSGFALVLTGNLSSCEGPAEDQRLFPAPLALGGSLSGEGLGVWADSENVSAVLWREGIPVLYRCSSRAEGEPGEVIDWIRRSSGKPFEVLLLDSRADADAGNRLEIEARRTWDTFPALASLDLSARQMDYARRMESLSSSIGPILAGFLVLGLLFAAIAGLDTLSSKNRLAGYEKGAIRLYREVFDPEGPVRDPLSQAKARLAMATGQANGPSLAGSLAIVGRAGKKASAGIQLESLRLSDQGTELSGKGASVETIRAFQQNLGNKESTSLDDLQQLPGDQFRFRITVRRGQP